MSNTKQLINNLSLQSAQKCVTSYFSGIDLDTAYGNAYLQALVAEAYVFFQDSDYVNERQTWVNEAGLLSDDYTNNYHAVAANQCPDDQLEQSRLIDLITVAPLFFASHDIDGQKRQWLIMSGLATYNPDEDDCLINNSACQALVDRVHNFADQRAG